MQGYHEPVLLREVVSALKVADGWYLDSTFGDGGYSLEILRMGGKVVGVDVDPQALKRAEERFGKSGIVGEFRILQGNFRDIKKLTKQTEMKDQKFKGIVFDLGVSSLQLEAPERGFSFMKEGPLDMRMDPTLEVRAQDLVNGLNKGELYELFNKLGEENSARSLAEALVFTREVKPIQTTRELATLIEKTVGRRGKIHPATRVFQALRIAVNDELNALIEALGQVIELLEKNGRILVVSFHSLEDRIVKNTFRKWAKMGLGEIITKKPITPSALEVGRNIRSRSAKLRVFEKI